MKSSQWSALSQQSNDQTKRRCGQECHNDVDEVAHSSSSLVDEAQNENTHRDLDKAGADNEFNAFHKGPLDESRELCRRQCAHMPASTIRNLVNDNDCAQKG